MIALTQDLFHLLSHSFYIPGNIEVLISADTVTESNC